MAVCITIVGAVLFFFFFFFFKLFLNWQENYTACAFIHTMHGLLSDWTISEVVFIGQTYDVPQKQNLTWMSNPVVKAIRYASNIYF